MSGTTTTAKDSTYCSTAEACRLLGISRPTLMRLSREAKTGPKKERLKVDIVRLRWRKGDLRGLTDYLRVERVRKQSLISLDREGVE